MLPFCDAIPIISPAETKTYFFSLQKNTLHSLRFTWIVTDAVKRRPAHPQRRGNNPRFCIQHQQMPFSTTNGQSNPKRMKRQRNALITDLQKQSFIHSKSLYELVRTCVDQMSLFFLQRAMTLSWPAVAKSSSSG